MIAFDRRLPTTCASRFDPRGTVSGVGGNHHVELMLLALPFEEAHLLGDDARHVDQLGLEDQVALVKPLGVQEVVEDPRACASRSMISR